MHQIINKFLVPGSFSFHNISEMMTEKDESKNLYTSYMHMFICPYHIYMAKNCELLLRGEPRTCHLFLLYITKKKANDDYIST